MIWTLNTGVCLAANASRCSAARAAGCIGAGEENREGNLLAERFFLLLDELHGFRGFGGVEMGALRRDDDEIGTADGVTRHHICRAFQVDDDESALQRLVLDEVDD